MAEDDPEMSLVRLAKEEEGIGVSTGAHLAGVRSALLMQNHGFLQSINGIVSCALLYKIPLLRSGNVGTGVSLIHGMLHGPSRLYELDAVAMAHAESSCPRSSFPDRRADEGGVMVRVNCRRAV